MKIIKILADKWNKIALNYKIFVVLFFGVTTPIIITAVFLLSSLYNTEIEKIQEASLRILDTNAIEISNNIQVVQTSAQLIKTNRSIIDFLMTDKIEATDIYQFKRIYVREIENILTSNPDINNIRVYYGNSNIPEMWPIFYKKDRIENESWFKELSFDKTYIIYDYSENLSDYIGYVSDDDLASFFTKIQIDMQEDIVIEISMKMETLFKQKKLCF